MWVTVYEADDEAERIWRDEIGFPAERIQRLGEDNFWRMGDTGPCGPSSEIFWDLGPDHGPDGGPITDSDRYIEIWNLVFMTYDQRADGTRVPLPKPSIDTGAGLERNLMIAQGVDAIWDIDVFQPLIAAAEQATGVAYGTSETQDISLRILGEHARTMTFMVSDGVRPSNQERGYVLRRIIRRAVRHAYLLGARDLVTPTLVDATIDVMGNAYPEIVARHDVIAKVIRREEESFRATLQRGLDMLDELLARGDISGEDAFFLHDTLGFPIDLTREIAGERGHTVDVDGFEARMREQRRRARAAADEAGAVAGAPVEVYREHRRRVRHHRVHRPRRVHLGSDGARAAPRRRAGRAGRHRDTRRRRARPHAVLRGVGRPGRRHRHDLDHRTDADDDGVLDVEDTRYGLPGVLTVHQARVRTGTIAEGDTVTAAIDGVRRDRIRRNHTATHILHWALREVLGSHVQQAGSLVAPDRLRFDFSHYEPVTHEQLVEIERLANAQIIADIPVRHFETSKAEAERLGAIAFFGEKYGDTVRVLDAGPSIELCGGTHVDALGFIGPIKIVSEGSIGSNLRRIEAMTGDGALEYIEQEEQLLRRTGELLRAAPKELPEKVERLVEQVRALQDEVQRLKAREATAAAGDLASGATRGVLVVRHDGLGTGELQATRGRDAAHARERCRRARRERRRQGRGRGRGEQGPGRTGRVGRLDRGPGGQGARRWRRTRQGCRRGRRSEGRRGRHRARARARAGGRVAAVTTRTGRVLGVDLGSKRIGLALSDPTRTIASPHAVLARGRDHAADHAAIVAAAARGRRRHDRRRASRSRCRDGKARRRGRRGSRSRSCRRSRARRSRSWCTTSG